MANIRGLGAAGLLVTCASGASIAMSPQDVSAEVKSCKAMAGDKERLRSFDDLFGEPSKEKLSEEKQVKDSPEGKQGHWLIDDSKSPTDGSPQVVAANFIGDSVLILRCKEQTTEAAFSTQYNYLGYKSVDVALRINDQIPIKEVWKASINGRAAFAPDAIAFIKSLPENGKLSITTTRTTDGKVKEGNFNLGAVSEVRNKIAKACDWASGSVDEPVGTTNREEKR
jgi:Type VI secretion system VasI, EvfG, VC_A0118